MFCVQICSRPARPRRGETATESRGSGISPSPGLSSVRAAAPAAGLTLLELMVVLAIMVITLAMAVPAFNSMARGADMRGAVSGVRNTLSQSRQWAITHREQVTFNYLTLTARSSAFWVVSSAGGATPQMIQQTNWLPLSVRFRESGTVSFRSDGSLASGATTVQITLVSSNFSRYVKINGLSGGIRITDAE